MRRWYTLRRFCVVLFIHALSGAVLVIVALRRRMPLNQMTYHFDECPRIVRDADDHTATITHAGRGRMKYATVVIDPPWEHAGNSTNGPLAGA